MGLPARPGPSPGLWPLGCAGSQSEEASPQGAQLSSMEPLVAQSCMSASWHHSWLRSHGSRPQRGGGEIQCFVDSHSGKVSHGEALRYRVDFSARDKKVASF